MATLVLAIGVAIYFSAEKLHEHKKKKRALKALEETQHGLIEERTPTDNDIDAHFASERPPVCEKDFLPPYPAADQHPALRVKTGSKRFFRFHL
jgi:hypothetical protein